MAKGPTWNAQRGTWYVQYWDGKWKKKTVSARVPNFKPGMKAPAKAPPEAHAAVKHYADVERRARDRRVAGVPTLLDEFLRAHVETYRKESTRENVRAVVDQFLAWCAGRKIVRFADVTPGACGDWIDELAKEQAYETVRRKRAQLSVAWNRLVKKRRIGENPWDDVEIDGKEAKVRGSWTKEEFEKIKAAAAPWLRDVLIMGVNTGLRINALMKVEWSDWRHARAGEKHFGFLVIRKEIDKRNIGYEVPVSRELHDLLAGRLGAHPTFILTGRFGRPLSGRNITHRAICDACEKAGLPKPVAPNHHMRRTFGRWAHFGYLTGKPVPLYIVSQWLGHTNVKTTLIYLGIKEEDSSRFMVGDGD